MGTVQQEIYESIRGQLLEGRFLPGQKLGEEQLAAKLGVNRNPVREALLKLTGEGFLERQAGIGCRVARIDVRLFRDVWQLRESVESTAARLAARRIQPVQVIKLEHQVDLMRRLAKPGRHAEITETDDAFHRMLVEFSGNRVLLDVWRQYLARIVSAQFLVQPKGFSPTLADHDRTIREHRRIVHALRAHDADAAERAVRLHLAGGLRKTIQLWKKARIEVD